MNINYILKQSGGIDNAVFTLGIGGTFKIAFSIVHSSIPYSDMFGKTGECFQCVPTVNCKNGSVMQ